MSTLAEDMKVAGLKTHLIDTRHDYVLDEIRCVQCKTIICAIVMRTEDSCDLVFPYTLKCNGDGSHALLPRAKGDLTNVEVKGRGIEKWEAEEYLRRFVE